MNAPFRLSLAIALLLVAAFPKPALASETAQPEDSVRQWLKDYIQQQSGGTIELVSFQKTNGKTGTVDGSPVYTMDFDLVIRFRQSCRWKITPQFDPTLTFGVVVMQANGSRDPWGNFLAASTNPGVSVNQGNTFKISGQERSEMTEKGWIVNQLTESAIQPVGQ